LAGLELTGLVGGGGFAGCSPLLGGGGLEGGGLAEAVGGAGLRGGGLEAGVGVALGGGLEGTVCFGEGFEGGGCLEEVVLGEVLEDEALEDVGLDFPEEDEEDLNDEFIFLRYNMKIMRAATPAAKASPNTTPKKMPAMSPKE